MSWCSNSLLRRFEELKASGCALELREGQCIGRGFADLGYEVFHLLPGEKLLSLYTGSVSRLEPGQRAHFFAVPDCDALVRALDERQFEIEKVEHVKRREWRLVVRSKGLAFAVPAAPTLQEALLEALFLAARAGVDRASRIEPIILASASPRRRQLLSEAAVAFEIFPAEVDESEIAGEPPQQMVERLAASKAQKLAALHHGRWVLAADTTVVLDGVIFGKPVDAREAHRFLSALQGRTHEVFTGIALLNSARNVREVLSCRSLVTFIPLSDAEIAEYVATGEPLDKAGGYAVQDRGASLIESIEGSYTNVVGLNISVVTALLRKHRVPCFPGVTGEA